MELNLDLRDKQIDELIKDSQKGMAEMEVGEKEYKNCQEGVAKLIEAEAKLYTAMSEAELNKQKAKDEKVQRWVEVGGNLIINGLKLAAATGLAFLAMGFEKENIVSFSASRAAFKDSYDSLFRK